MTNVDSLRQPRLSWTGVEQTILRSEWHSLDFEFFSVSAVFSRLVPFNYCPIRTAIFYFETQLNGTRRPAVGNLMLGWLRWADICARANLTPFVIWLRPSGSFYPPSVYQANNCSFLPSIWLICFLICCSFGLIFKFKSQTEHGN